MEKNSEKNETRQLKKKHEQRCERLGYRQVDKNSFPSWPHEAQPDIRYFLGRILVIGEIKQTEGPTDPPSLERLQKYITECETQIKNGRADCVLFFLETTESSDILGWQIAVQKMIDQSGLDGKLKLQRSNEEHLTFGLLTPNQDDFEKMLSTFGPKAPGGSP